MEELPDNVINIVPFLEARRRRRQNRLSLVQEDVSEAVAASCAMPMEIINADPRFDYADGYWICNIESPITVAFSQKNLEELMRNLRFLVLNTVAEQQFHHERGIVAEINICPEGQILNLVIETRRHNEVWLAKLFFSAPYESSGATWHEAVINAQKVALKTLVHKLTAGESVDVSKVKFRFRGCIARSK